jgi:hypothetical protein
MAEPPLDGRVAIALIRRAEQFERAVATGEDFDATMAATTLVAGLKRFLPNAFSRLSLPRLAPQRFNFRAP